MLPNFTKKRACKSKIMCLDNYVHLGVSNLNCLVMLPIIHSTCLKAPWNTWKATHTGAYRLSIVGYMPEINSRLACNKTLTVSTHQHLHVSWSTLLPTDPCYMVVCAVMHEACLYGVFACLRDHCRHVTELLKCIKADKF